MYWGLQLYNNKSPPKDKSAEFTKFTNLSCVNCARLTIVAIPRRTVRSLYLSSQSVACVVHHSRHVVCAFHQDRPVACVVHHNHLPLFRCFTFAPSAPPGPQAPAAWNSASNSSPVIFSLSIRRAADLWSTSSCARMISFALA